MTRKKLKHIEKRKMRKECYALNNSFIKWILPRLKIYLHDASKVIDMSWEEEKVSYKGKEYFFGEAIERMIEILDKWHIEDITTEEYYVDIDEFLSLFQKTFHGLWW